MKKLSLQVKITLLCTAILTAACVLLTVSSVLFSSRGLVGVAKQATMVITDYAVSFKDAYSVLPAQTLDPESMSEKELLKLIADVTKQMKKAAAELNFEAAAELRDKLIELKKMLKE